MSDTSSACYSPEDMDIVHQGYAATGETVPSPSGSGVEMEVWTCLCGEDTDHVLPAHLRG
jgi:hypothetical protein